MYNKDPSVRIMLAYFYTQSFVTGMRVYVKLVKFGFAAVYVLMDKLLQ